MRTQLLLIITAALLLAITTFACGGGRYNSASSGSLAVPQDQELSDSSESHSAQLTDEDYKLIAMTPDARWDYLFAKFQRMVKERYGVDIDYEPYPGKGTSGFGDDGTNGSNHQVQYNEDFNATPKLNEVLEESLDLSSNGDTWTWDISFLERLAGDFSWDGFVSIEDMTPVVDHLWHIWNESAIPPQWLHD